MAISCSLSVRMKLHSMSTGADATGACANHDARRLSQHGVALQHLPRRRCAVGCRRGCGAAKCIRMCVALPMNVRVVQQRTHQLRRAQPGTAWVPIRIVGGGGRCFVRPVVGGVGVFVQPAQGHATAPCFAGQAALAHTGATPVNTFLQQVAHGLFHQAQARTRQA